MFALAIAAGLAAPMAATAGGMNGDHAENRKRFIVKAILIAGTMLVMMATANAADISTKYHGGVAWDVYVTGEIKPGDDERFSRVTRQLPSSAVVMLNSPGGDVAAGLGIGEEISARQFETAVSDLCASVCGLIWLAGSHRMMVEDARIGFHAAFYLNGQVSSNANAVIGAYLNRLGFSYTTIEFLTYASPDSMQWLTNDQATRYFDAWVFPKLKKPTSVQRPNVWMTAIGTIAIAIFLLGAWKKGMAFGWLRLWNMIPPAVPAGKLTAFDKVLLSVTAMPVLLLAIIMGALVFH